MLLSLFNWFRQPNQKQSQNTKKDEEVFKQNPLKKMYDHNLIPTLLHHHKELFVIWGNCLELARSKQYESFKKEIQKFYRALCRHVSTEDSRFYIYLCSDPYIKETGILMQNRMSLIKTTINDFVEKYINVADTDINHEELEEELNDLTFSLKSRIETEERELYPLYK